MVHIPSGRELLHRAFNVSFVNVIQDVEAVSQEPSYWSGLYRTIAVIYCIYLVLALIDLRRVFAIVQTSMVEDDEGDPQKMPMEGVMSSPSPSQSPTNSPGLGAGGTMLLNPVLGLFGDFLVLHSHGLGRRMFLRTGVIMAAVGILICMLSDAHHNFYWFMVGILLWRLGECMNDVTMEALAPEMIPSTQYAMAGSVKGALFLLGGVLGYVLLMFTVKLHFSWLYAAYLVMMLVCSMPALFLLRESSHVRRSSQSRLHFKPGFDYLTYAYLAPARLPGGFSLACLSVFVFALGTAPMFFLLLVVRDLVGIQSQVLQQREFSYLSVTFFIFAVVAAVFSGDGGRQPGRDGRIHHTLEDESQLHARARKLILAVVGFGIVAIAMPFMTLLPSPETRMVYFYGIAIAMGFCFGAAYTRFQDITWSLIPEDAEWANVMGFNVMCRNTGVGLGNFLAGVILNMFAMQGYTEVVSVSSERMNLEHQAAYESTGYYVMCGASGVAVLISALLATHSVDQQPGEATVLRALSPGYKAVGNP
mmetsp:Transcript_50079/g.79938  ORF Transcript_50079/g.79938 Transcript_50079/m.79938 type:complete len:533 (+) Transcript_50079:36-1634(+)